MGELFFVEEYINKYREKKIEDSPMNGVWRAEFDKHLFKKIVSSLIF